MGKREWLDQILNNFWARFPWNFTSGMRNLKWNLYSIYLFLYEFSFLHVPSLYRLDKTFHQNVYLTHYIILWLIVDLQSYILVATINWLPVLFCLCFHHSAAKSLQSCPTLCDSIDSSPLGSPVPGILQARTLEWVAISFSSAWKWKVKVRSLSRPRLLVTPWTAAYQAPLSMGFSRQEYWSGVPFHHSRRQI